MSLSLTHSLSLAHIANEALEEALSQLKESVTPDEGKDTPIATDGVLAQSSTQASSLWRLREDITLALAQAGHVYKYDLSTPVSQIYKLVEDTREEVANFQKSRQENEAASETTTPLDIRVSGYGHLGDGNVHLNVYTPGVYEEREEVMALLEPRLWEEVKGLKGSVSAEHGIGRMKRNKMKYSKTEASMKLMKEIKDLFDPEGILNPGKVLPDE